MFIEFQLSWMWKLAMGKQGCRLKVPTILAMKTTAERWTSHFTRYMAFLRQAQAFCFKCYNSDKDSGNLNAPFLRIMLSSPHSWAASLSFARFSQHLILDKIYQKNFLAYDFISIVNATTKNPPHKLIHNYDRVLVAAATPCRRAELLSSTVRLANISHMCR